MRLFIAIELTDVMRRHLAGVQAELRGVVGGNVSWVKPENLHLTMKFLGAVDDPDVPGVCEALGAIDADGPIELHATGMECFPPGGAVRVIGCAVEGQVERLKALYGRIEDACHDLGFPREPRAYRPHITFGRARTVVPAALRHRMSQTTARRWPGPAMVVERFALIQSLLRKTGAQYTPVAHFPL